MVELWRVDPVDGVAYEWFSYLDHYSRKYKEEDIQEYWYSKCKPIFAKDPEEKRVDPADGLAYTFEEMSCHYKDAFRKKAIQAYWENECKPAPKEAEQRIDQLDMKPYTFEELRRYYKSEGFTEDHIKKYWEQDCAFLTISPLRLPASAEPLVSPLHSPALPPQGRRAQPQRAVSPLELRRQGAAADRKPAPRKGDWRQPTEACHGRSKAKGGQNGRA
eukprot:TRINITY_DN100888_c0_g1_i1.p1 TRINITY_DN100888_c0_g1~~TRINITY_DN100888_c0_g1_i1.p1  ORF type:complete len:218 (+),score=47.80 TRINITY_DN100888_c0_g1_i1:102-755(+)